jgi:hypothetical protein
MRVIHRDDLEKIHLPGRIIEKAIGVDSFSASQEMTVGFAHYSSTSGPMTPHRHAEEVVYILSSKAGYIRYGADPDDLDILLPLEPGMILHIPESEWHVFEYEDGGYVEIIFIYGQVENIRAEEN